ncbi:hypothetical protein FRX31_034434 [Thalictrum thalictroides]|uniref:Uncharacterized protein n=1 Tax=Thalictrum thalictroides TaxID=46969 RepID=A0A7J6UTU1_THATH|nr:hypothetical protein FRX31_034434 [Thalictrum thalictroides]
MAWSFLNGESQFAKYMRSKYCNRDGDLIEYHKRSSLWPRLKWGIVYMKRQTTWVVGDGSTIDLWRNSWCGDSIKERLNLSSKDLK